MTKKKVKKKIEENKTKKEKAKLKKQKTRENKAKRKEKKKSKRDLRKIGLKISRAKGKREVKTIKKTKTQLRKIGRKIIKSRTKPTKKRKIERVFEKTVSSITIPDILREQPSELNQHYKRLFKKSVSDKELRNILAEESNIQKIKWRFEIQGRIIDEKNRTLARFKKGSGGDLLEVKELIKGRFWKGQRFEGTDNEGLTEERGYQFEFLQKGNVNRIEVKITFRS